MTESEVYVTDVVTRFTTYCPYATELAINNKTYTVTEATSLTITDCPCTVTKKSSSLVGAVTGVPSSGYLPANSSIIKPTGNVTVPATLQTVSTTSAFTAAATTAGSSSSSASAASAAQSTGGASQFGASLAGLVIAAGVAVFAL